MNRGQQKLPSRTQTQVLVAFISNVMQVGEVFRAMFTAV
jgi:hypothetical protein